MTKFSPRVLAAVAAGIVVIILAFGHIHGFNGPDYWRWEWRSQPDVWRALLFLGLAASPAIIAQWIFQRRAAASSGLILLCIAVIALQLTSNAIEPDIHGAARIRRVANDQLTTSYFTVAESIDRARRSGHPVDWLRQYDELLALAPQHATTKPPAPVAFYVLVFRLFGPQRAPLGAALLMTLLSAIAVVATWSAARSIEGPEAAFQAATLMALAPSMTVFFLYLDTTYPILSCALLATWFAALKTNRTLDAVAFGLVLFATTMTSYTLLVLGIALGGMTLGRNPRATLRLTAIALAAFVVAYAVLWLSTGFDPISAFRAALAMQYRYLPLLHRPWPRTIPFDFLDFCLGMGWVPVVLVLFRLFHKQDRALIWGLMTPLIVALTGLIQAETARVWIFMMPLVMIPAGVELSRWPVRERIAVHAAMIAVTIALYANMTFIATS